MTDRASPAGRSPVVLGPGEGRTYPTGRLSAVFKTAGVENGQKYSIWQWWLEAGTGTFVLVPVTLAHDVENRGTERAGVLTSRPPATSKR